MHMPVCYTMALQIFLFHLLCSIRKPLMTHHAFKDAAKHTYTLSFIVKKKKRLVLVIFLSFHYQCSVTWHMLGSCSPCDRWDCCAYREPSAAYRLWFVQAVLFFFFLSGFQYTQTKRMHKVLCRDSNTCLELLCKPQEAVREKCLLFCHALHQERRIKSALKRLEQSLKI